jgi:hypothetical protein
LNVMADHFSVYYIGMRMAVFAGEDCWDPQAIVLTAALQSMIDKKVPDIWNHIYFVNAYLCKAKKVWEDDLSVEVMRELLALEKRCVIGPDKKIIPEEIPSWAIDLHTTKGREYAKAGEWDKVDRRFGGELVGILTRVLMYKKYGRIGPELGFDEYWEAMSIVKTFKGRDDDND